MFRPQFQSTILEPWTNLLSYYIKCKADFRKFTVPGIPTSVLAGYVAYKSDWGEHPVAQPSCQGKDRGNNLSLLLAPPKWSGGKPLKYDGQKYRSYQSLLDWVVDYSDYIIWGDFLPALSGGLTEFLMCTGEPTCYDQVLEIIQTFGLGALDDQRLSYEKKLVDSRKGSPLAPSLS